MRGAEWEPVEIFLEVGAADAAGVDADEHLSGADLRNGDDFHAHVVDSPVDSGLHGRGNRMRRSFDRVRSGNGHRGILDDLGERVRFKSRGRGAR